ncbi:transcription factor bHLH47-like [Impatiens glandulifera]|uniref:transcription factor bHLH47-like n=1 Tax=Impatiens glandulifera TaxID=253017 RepID=UPI001FB1036A|nr:transcription factor bHLH47-like [Impatiens glandulifera]
MDSELSEEVSVPTKASINDSKIGQKNKGKVPKRVHKSEREKMKREHLNDLFINLANALGLSEANNGKASILAETSRVLKDVYSIVDNLKRENATLLSESQYMTVEKSELLDEKSALEAQIRKLRIELEERMTQSKPDLNKPPPEEPATWFSSDPALQYAPYINSVYIIPMCSDLQANMDHSGAAQFAANSPSNLAKPQSRYPNPADSWPSQLAK